VLTQHLIPAPEIITSEDDAHMTIFYSTLLAR
jgi:hypothetical protein